MMDYVENGMNILLLITLIIIITTKSINTHPNFNLNVIYICIFITIIKTIALCYNLDYYAFIPAIASFCGYANMKQYVKSLNNNYMTYIHDVSMKKIEL